MRVKARSHSVTNQDATAAELFAGPMPAEVSDLYRSARSVAVVVVVVVAAKEPEVFAVEAVVVVVVVVAVAVAGIQDLRGSIEEPVAGVAEVLSHRCCEGQSIY